MADTRLNMNGGLDNKQCELCLDSYSHRLDFPRWGQRLAHPRACEEAMDEMGWDEWTLQHLSCDG